MIGRIASHLLVNALAGLVVLLMAANAVALAVLCLLVAYQLDQPTIASFMAVGAFVWWSHEVEKDIRSMAGVLP